MKNTTLALVIVVVIVLLGGWYYFAHSSAPAPAAGTVATSTEPVTNPHMTGGNSAPLETTNPNAGQTSNTSTSTTAPPPSSTVPGPNLTLGLTGAGASQHLVAYNGHTLYTYDPDRQASPASACTGACATAWPPYEVTTTTGLVAEYPLTGTIGTITRSDGKLQVTYNHLPLYFYAGDLSATDARGDGAGGVWHLAKP